MKIFSFRVFLFCFSLLFQQNAFAQIAPAQHSVTPPLVTIDTINFPDVHAFGLISSNDTLQNSPAFRFGGTADGAGLLRNGNGTFMMLVNHEENKSVSRIFLDSAFRPVAGDYLMNSNAGYWRLCSATMATPEEHGFGPYFLTGSEENLAWTHYVNPYGPPIHDSAVSFGTTLAVGLGQWRAENTVPLPVASYNKTIICIGDDDAGLHGGQFAMYIGNSVGDLINGKLYVLRRNDLNQRERDIIPGQIYPVELAEVPPAYIGWNTYTLDAFADTNLKAIRFNRIEDLDYRKGNAAAGREIYFNSSGLANPDTVDRTLWGRVYRLKLDSLDPTHGTIECVINGDDKDTANPGHLLYSPDNICVTEDYVYVQEDPNSFGFQSALPYVHDAKVYQYDIQSGTFKTLLTMDHHRHAPDSAIYNRHSNGIGYNQSGTGSWEFGAMLDATPATGIPRFFTLNLQVHSWRDSIFRGVDGGTRAVNENQGSMVVSLSGVPRIKVNPPITIGDTICENESGTLTAFGGTTFAGTNGTIYNWYNSPTGGTPFYTGNALTNFVSSTSVTFYVETAADGIVSATRTPVTCMVVPAPPQPVISQFGIYLLSSAFSGNQWLLNGTPLAGETAAGLTVLQSGNYSVQVSQYGCLSAQSNSIYIGTATLANGPQETIYPNPGDKEIILLADSLYAADIYASNGKLVQHLEFSQAVFPAYVDIESLADGLYFIALHSKRGTTNIRFVKEGE